MSTGDFDHGSLILDKTHEILPRETKGHCIILGAIKKWKEDIDFDSDEMPRIVGTKQEMEQLKIDSEYQILEFAELILMFAQPEGNTDDDAFPFPLVTTTTVSERSTSRRMHTVRRIKVL